MSTPRSIFRGLLRGIVLVLGGIVALALCYLGAALLLGLVPRHHDFANAAGGTRIVVVSDGVHTDIVVPMDSLSLVRRKAIDLSDLNVASPNHLYLAIGWGDREFYLSTPSWADLRAGTAWRALTGANGTVVHIQATEALEPSANARAVTLTDDQLARLLAFVEGSFAIDASGKVERIAGAHYGKYDAFYVANGHYSFIQTCNEWARTALDEGGVRVPVWSPFAAAIFFQLP